MHYRPFFKTPNFEVRVQYRDEIRSEHPARPRDQDFPGIRVRHCYFTVYLSFLSGRHHAGFS